MKKAILNTLILVCICAVMTLLLAVTNQFTAPIIAEQLAAQAGAALGEILPEGVTATEVTDATLIEKFPKTVTKAYTCSNGWSVVEITTGGYADGLVFLCAVDGEGTVQNFQYIADNETDTFGGVQLENGTIFSLFIGIKTDTLDRVDVHTGATETAKGVRLAVNDAINTAALLRGEDVDTRTPEEILQDNLNTALPAGEGKFTKLFITEVIEGIDAVYTADNGKGSVYVVGEYFIPVDENGGLQVFDSISPEIQQNVAAASVILGASTAESIDLTAFEGLPSQLVSAQKTATGNYILEIKGAGYGINGGDDYHPASGKYIMIRVSLTPEGKIIDTLTVSQEESKGIGDVCATEKFYGQFDGKTEADYKDVDAISGATLTTNGYLKAIERAFNVVKILEGGTNE